MAAITGIDFGVALNNTVIPATITLTDTGEYPSTPAVPETKAIANYNVNSLTGISTGTEITITVENPEDEFTTIATYTTQTGDNTWVILTPRLVTAISGNVIGCVATDMGAGILRVSAPTGSGAGINGLKLGFAWAPFNYSSTTFSGGVTEIPGTSVQTDIKGWFRVTQPDGITIDMGSALAPAVEDLEGTLTAASWTLRTAIDGNFQKGQYTIIYNIAADGYDDTTLTKQFTVAFDKPTAVITPTTDVFTPSIRMTDATVYSQTGVTLQSSTRSWIGVIEDVATPTAGNVAQFDMISGGEYYFANYEATLVANLTYQLTEATYVTLITRVTGTADTTATAPMTFQEITDLVEALLLQGWYDTERNVDSGTVKWNHLVSIFWLFRTQGANGELNAIFELYERIIALIEELDTTDLYTPPVPDGSELAAYTWA
jgi:hypothetical protein